MRAAIGLLPCSGSRDDILGSGISFAVFQLSVRLTDRDSEGSLGRRCQFVNGQVSSTHGSRDSLEARRCAMSVSGVESSPVLQWLQTYLSRGGSNTASPCSCPSTGSQPSGDTASISQQALQLNALQTAQSTDPSQASGTTGAQGHHHRHHHHHGGQGNGQQSGSFIDRLAQSIVTDLQQANGSETSSQSSTSAGSSGNNGSFIDKLASAIANNLLAQYQQSTGSTTSTSPTGPTNQVNAVA